VPHDWTGAIRGGSIHAARHAPDWINGGNTDGPTCAACGVTLLNKYIRPDRQGMSFRYRDALGREIISLVELGCPTFLGDVAGAAAESKQRIRGLDGRVDHVLDRVDTVEDRLARLEAENAELRAKVDARPEIDVTEMVEWLATLVQRSVEARLPTLPVSVRGQQYALPEPVANMIIDVAVIEKSEPVPVKRRRKRA
jgi:hypothetical protein